MMLHFAPHPTHTIRTLMTKTMSEPMVRSVAHQIDGAEPAVLLLNHPSNCVLPRVKGVLYRLD